MLFTIHESIFRKLISTDLQYKGHFNQIEQFKLFLDNWLHFANFVIIVDTQKAFQIYQNEWLTLLTLLTLNTFYISANYGYRFLIQCIKKCWPNFSFLYIHHTIDTKTFILHSCNLFGNWYVQWELIQDDEIRQFPKTFLLLTEIQSELNMSMGFMDMAYIECFTKRKCVWKITLFAKHWMQAYFSKMWSCQKER